MGVRMSLVQFKKIHVTCHFKGRRQNMKHKITKCDKSLLVRLHNSGIPLVHKIMQRFV